MKVRDAIWIMIALVLSELMLAGMINTEQYRAAASAQANGFDALAHRIFPWGPDQARTSTLAPRPQRAPHGEH